MTHKRTNVIFVVLLVLLVSGCQGQTTGPGASQGGTPTTSSATRLAPSYEEIQSQIKEMLAAAGQPSGPEVGPDGLVDRELAEKIRNYSDSITGSRVENWQGRFLDAEWIDGAWLERPPYYIVGILMGEPSPGFKPAPNLSLNLYEATEEQEAELKAFQVGQDVVFSGTLLGVNAFGEVYVENGVIQPAE